MRQLITAENVSIKAGLYSVGDKFADSLVNLNWDSTVQNDDMLRLNCYDSVMAPVFSEEIELTENQAIQRIYSGMCDRGFAHGHRRAMV